MLGPATKRGCSTRCRDAGRSPSMSWSSSCAAAAARSATGCTTAVMGGPAEPDRALATPTRLQCSGMCNCASCKARRQPLCNAVSVTMSAVGRGCKLSKRRVAA